MKDSESRLGEEDGHSRHIKGLYYKLSGIEHDYRRAAITNSMLVKFYKKMSLCISFYVVGSNIMIFTPYMSDMMMSDEDIHVTTLGPFMSVVRSVVRTVEYFLRETRYLEKYFFLCIDRTLRLDSLYYEMSTCNITALLVKF